MELFFLVKGIYEKYLAANLDPPERTKIEGWLKEIEQDIDCIIKAKA